MLSEVRIDLNVVERTMGARLKENLRFMMGDVGVQSGCRELKWCKRR